MQFYLDTHFRQSTVDHDNASIGSGSGGGGGCVSPKIFSGGTSPLKFQGGRKIGREKKKERKIKNSSNFSIGSKQMGQNR